MYVCVNFIYIYIYIYIWKKSKIESVIKLFLGNFFSKNYINYIPFPENINKQKCILLYILPRFIFLKFIYLIYLENILFIIICERF